MENKIPLISTDFPKGRLSVWFRQETDQICVLDKHEGMMYENEYFGYRFPVTRHWELKESQSWFFVDVID